MAYTDVWNNAIPTGAEAANTIDDIFRSLKLDISERFVDLFSMANFTADPLRPGGLKFYDTADAKLFLGDNAGTPRAILIRDKADSTTYAQLKYTGLVLSPATLASASVPLINASQTWNNGATAFTAILLNITSTASAAASLLADYQIAGSSKWSVTKSGAVTQAAGLIVSTGEIQVPGGIYSIKGISASINNGVTATIYTLTQAGARVNIAVVSPDDSSIVAIADAVTNGAGAIIALSVITSNRCTITYSGNDIQVTNNSGGAVTFKYNIVFNFCF